MILNRVSLLSLLIVSTCSNLAPADTPCDYENNIKRPTIFKIIQKAPGKILNG